MSNTSIKSDFLVVGGGIAGLLFALKSAQLGVVSLLLKEDFSDSSTQYAQGGINAVVDGKDSFDSHIKDTLDCGYGLCHEEIVKMVVNAGPEAIHDLESYGVRFTHHKNGAYDLHREGGHSFNRVVHATDATGAEIMRALKQAVIAHPNIHIYTRHMAIDLILSYQPGSKTITNETRTLGAYVYQSQTDQVIPFLAHITYLATGGIGKIYPYTSNPHTATGDGIVMAYRAGIDVVNMEFIQFHPTILFHSEQSNFLISEVVRGEGGILKNHKNEPFMERYHPHFKDLAPRDVVARAIDMEMKKSGKPYMFLDATHLSLSHIKSHFPNIHHMLKTVGLDMSKQPIPVVPAAHYCCGGIRVGSYGETECQGLFAGGECSFTGFHGANRLASNSLLEAVVFAKRSFQYIAQHHNHLWRTPLGEVAPWVCHDFSDAYEASLIQPLWRELRQFMWNYLGITRTDKRLERAQRRMALLRQEIEEYYWNFKLSKDLIELRNISIVSELIIQSACLRKESRGFHFNADHPQENPLFSEDTILNIREKNI